VREALEAQTSAQRNRLVLRVPLGAHGVASGGKALPHLPDSMVHILGHARRSGAQTMQGALVARQATDWALQGSEGARFTVTKARKVTRQEEW
jgi:hypothetical protein